MGYCFVTTEKITTLGALTAKYNHNYRTVQVDNADPALKHLNDEVLQLPSDEKGNKMTYVDFFSKKGLRNRITIKTTLSERITCLP